VFNLKSGQNAKKPAQERPAILLNSIGRRVRDHSLHLKVEALFD